MSGQDWYLLRKKIGNSNLNKSDKQVLKKYLASDNKFETNKRKILSKKFYLYSILVISIILTIIFAIGSIYYFLEYYKYSRKKIFIDIHTLFSLNTTVIVTILFILLFLILIYIPYSAEKVPREAKVKFKKHWTFITSLSVLGFGLSYYTIRLIEAISNNNDYLIACYLKSGNWEKFTNQSDKQFCFTYDELIVLNFTGAVFGVFACLTFLFFCLAFFLWRDSYLKNQRIKYLKAKENYLKELNKLRQKTIYLKPISYFEDKL